MDWSETIFRLGAALVIGGAIGLDRNLHHKSMGMRTLALVAVGSAAAVIGVGPSSADVSRVMQGVVTGIGFLGAGAILHGQKGKKVHGLTTAAAVWVTAILGMLCGLAAWQVVITAVAFIALLLLGGGAFERWAHEKLGAADNANAPPPEDDGA